ncbi:MAG: gliding motility lipoprotein GldD [Saprospiraceae bacterium]|nr:gliding motility lipoprotein GldD [Saprospiraceae bacterium]
MANIKRHYKLLLVFTAFVFIYSCGSDYVPKPRGYFRLDLPKKEYIKFDTTYPYTFDYPAYSKIYPDNSVINETYWLNIVYPDFKGTLHLSYKPVTNNLEIYLDNAREFANKHIPKANAINQSLVINREKKVYGLIYDIEGNKAASPYQFYLTDSTNHFVRGALYFRIVPNNDSLAPVISFIKKDLERMINSFSWKNENHKKSEN